VRDEIMTNFVYYAIHSRRERFNYDFLMPTAA